ncbi:MAG: cobalamin biosynthesis protein CobS, partial [Terrabacter sp.]|nr:cobalamin biosynthesis protein CobS [Terrabacter sp.]
MRDAWRLALGTFTALRVGPPRRVDERALGGAMLLAPLTAVPAAVVWAALGLLAGATVVPSAVAAGLALVVTALVSRALHLDGLADL